MNGNETPINDLPLVDRKAIYISTVSAVTALFFFGVGLPCWYAFDLAWGIGLGAMCAFWGGPGFGVMAAGARLALHDERGATLERYVATASAAVVKPPVVAVSASMDGHRPEFARVWEPSRE